MLCLVPCLFDLFDVECIDGDLSRHEEEVKIFDFPLHLNGLSSLHCIEEETNDSACLYNCILGKC